MSEDLLGLIIFIIVAIAGLIGKLRKQEPEMQEPWQDIPRDLSERTKQFLFGDRTAPEKEPPESPSREYEQPLPPREMQRPQVQRRQPVPAQTRPARPRPQKPAPMEQDIGPKMRPGDVHVPSGELTKRADESRKKLSRPAMMPTLKSTLKPPPTRAARRERVAKEEAKPTAPVARFAHDLSDVRRGIILSEILGPPVSLRK
jgi:hypothetical protein